MKAMDYMRSLSDAQKKRVISGAVDVVGMTMAANTERLAYLIRENESRYSQQDAEMLVEMTMMVLALLGVDNDRA